jgi:hypothetical protein
MSYEGEIHMFSMFGNMVFFVLQTKNEAAQQVLNSPKN